MLNRIPGRFGFSRPLAHGSVVAAMLASSGLGHGPVVNGFLDWTVSGNALTIALKTLAGTDPTPNDPVLVWVRNATAAPAAGTATYSLMTITAALSLVISSGSTMGFVNATAGKLWAVLFNDGGTARIGAVNCLSGTNIYPLGGWPIASSTAEGGAGGADSAQTFYTGTAVTSKPYAVLGYATWETGLATAGNWSAGPTRAQVFGPGVPLPGARLQPLSNTDGAVATTATVIPIDDTIPQNTEGAQFMSQAITPTSAAHLLQIDHIGEYAVNANAYIAAALFQDSTANALVAMLGIAQASAAPMPVIFTHIMLAGTSSATTFKVRAGPNGSTLTFNGFSSGRIFGGVMGSRLTVQEIVT
jgi:hypothetical protein